MFFHLDQKPLNFWINIFPRTENFKRQWISSPFSITNPLVLKFIMHAILSTIASSLPRNKFVREIFVQHFKISSNSRLVRNRILNVNRTKLDKKRVIRRVNKTRKNVCESLARHNKERWYTKNKQLQESWTTPIYSSLSKLFF